MVICMRYGFGRRPSHCRGQALFLAVLVVMLILLIGGVFVATVVFSQSSSQVDMDRAAAQALADAGLRFVDRMLLTSPEGADWRPRVPPYALDTDSDPSTPGPYDMAADPSLMNADGQGTPYYTDMEMTRGWFAIREDLGGGTPGRYFRHGFAKYPDPRDPVHPGPDGIPGTADDFGDATTFGTGTVLLRVTYAPVVTDWSDPADPKRWSAGTLAKCIKIEAMGRVDSEGGRGIWQRVTAYKPYGITDFARFITDRDETGETAKLCMNPFIDYDDDGTVDAAEIVRTRIEGGILCNTSLTLVGDYADNAATNEIYLHSRIAPGPDGVLGTSDDVMGSVDDQSVRAQEIHLEYVTDPPVGGPSTDVYLDALPGDLPTGPIRDSRSSSFDTLNGRVLDDRKTADATSGIVRRADRLEPPDLQRESPTTSTNRYIALTRESGTYVQMASGSLENDGAWGYGEGIFIDNEMDIQFGHDLEALEADWLRASLTTGESGWSPTFTVYKPPAVRISLYPDEASITGGIAARIRDVDPGDVLSDSSLLWWPNHQAGAPGIRLERHDIDPATGQQRTWGYHQFDPGPDGTVGTPDDRYPGDDTRLHVMYLDYPENGVIAALGNVRIKGVLPPKPDGNGPDQSNRPDGSWRDYNLTIYSGGTIYIDSQLIKPSTAVLLDPNLASDPVFANLDPDPTANPNYFYLDYYDSHIALLATDCVCLNTTQIVPHRFSRPANEVEEDPLNPAAGGHFAVPNIRDAMIRTSVRIPRTSGGALAITAKHTGQEPGTAYISLSINGNLYDFGGGANEYVYSFSPQGTAPESASLSWSLSPTYAYLTGSARQPPFPAWPWQPPLAMLSIGPLTWNSIVFMPPATVPAIAGQVPGGSRDYWLRKFKIEELVDHDSDPNTSVEPIGTLDVHVDALIYAQNGSWFVIPGEYFEPNTALHPYDHDADPSTPDIPVGGDLDRDRDGVPDVDADADGNTITDADGDGVPDDFEYYARRFKRYNYRITITGAISENRPAGAEAVRDWIDKWSYPDFDAAGNRIWGQIVYCFDDTLRRARDNPDVVGTSQTTLCALPALPVSPELLFVDR